MKDVKYRIEAKTLYVIEGFSMAEIEKAFGGKVSRKTLYNWMEKERWNEKRKETFDDFVTNRDKIVNESLIIKDELFTLLKTVIKIANRKPTIENLNNVQFIKKIYDEHVKIRYLVPIISAKSDKVS